MTATLSRKSLAELSEFIGARLGLSFPSERWGDLARKTGLAAQGMGYPDPETFTRSVLSERGPPGDLDSLAGHLTVGETFFYREKRTLEVLQGNVFPAILQAGGSQRRLRIWSAGCASGEEPYTIAMMVCAFHGFRDWNVTIIGSDVNRSLLARAREGLYSDWSFRGVPDAIKTRYFRKAGASSYQILPEVRRMVAFEYLNLVGDEYPAMLTMTNAMDLILCRNVLMYFRAATAQKVIGKLQRSLVDGGWLVVSPVESPLITDAALSTVQFPDAFLFRKRARPAPAAVRKPARKPRRTPRVTLPPPPAESAYARALGCFAAARYDACISLLGDPASGLGEDSRAHELLARAHANAGRLEEAEGWCGLAIREDTLNAVLRYVLATILIEQDRLEQASAALRRAIYLDPQFVVAHFTLGQLLLRMGSSRKARGSLVNASLLLASRGVDEPVPEADGLSAGRLLEVIQSLLNGRAPS